MNYREYFVPYASEIDKFLVQFFQQKIKRSKKITPLAADIWEKLAKFIEGGKRIRGGLVKLGYECFSPAPLKKILPVSAAVEITQGAILVHDDIIDKSLLRHGRPTVHRLYQQKHQRKYKKGDALHYGESMAICVGDAGFYEAISLIKNSDFPEILRLRAIDQLVKTMIETCYGEALDVDLACREKISEKEILTIHTLKTAFYTIIGPLKIGGILAGVNEGQLKRFESYGLPVGVAFQLQDDILGIYGNEKELGKPVGDDIAEGKNTLLYTRAIKKGDSSQRKKLMSLWGKKGITATEINQARQIIKETGSLEYSQGLAHKLASQGKKSVPKITKNKELQEVFLSLADFVIGRKK